MVTDLSMPGMSGFDFAQQVLATRPDIPIVVSSGYIRHEDQERAQGMGIFRLIQKPHTLDELQHTLDQLFEHTVAPIKQPPQAAARDFDLV